MKESRADYRAALLQALGLHVVLFVLMFAGLHWSRVPIAEAAHGEVIEADLVSVSDLSASMQRALRRDPEPLPQPIVEPEPVPPTPDPLPDVLPEPPVEELPPPEPDPAPVEQEQVQRDADSAQVAKVDREQDEKRVKPEQAELDAARRRAEALAEIRKQRALAAQERTMAEQRAQQLNDARTTPATTPSRPPPGNPDSRSAENASYQVALMNAILRQWTRPESVALGQVCQVLIRQIPGGEVVSVEISPSCPYDEQGRRSVEAAILKASPLPYAGYESVFVRNPVLKFRAEDL